MKLELGSGDRPTPGYVHLDCRADAPEVDVVGDATALDECGIQPGFEEIRATHLLEHFSWRQTVTILDHWREFLHPSGLLYVEVPNLIGHVDAWKRGSSSDEQFVEYLFGEQDHEFNYHQTMFTPHTLTRALKDAGFVGMQVSDVGLVLCASAERPS